MDEEHEVSVFSQRGRGKFSDRGFLYVFDRQSADGVSRIGNEVLMYTHQDVL